MVRCFDLKRYGVWLKQTLLLIIRVFCINRGLLTMRGSQQRLGYRNLNYLLRILLQILLINKELKRVKVVQVAKRYLFYCTLNYAFFISDAGQTAHYGIESTKLTRKKLFAIMQRFVNESYQILQENGLGGEERKYKAVLIFYFGEIYFEKPIWDKIKQFRS